MYILSSIVLMLFNTVFAILYYGDVLIKQDINADLILIMFIANVVFISVALYRRLFGSSDINTINNYLSLEVDPNTQYNTKNEVTNFPMVLYKSKDRIEITSIEDSYTIILKNNGTYKFNING